MYKILLADDERQIREGIKQIIDWDSLGLTLLPLASNGKMALDLIKKHEPHIVITDLKMPGLGGLDLIEEVTNDSVTPTPRFIILSGFNDFEFAKSAMKHGIRHYLLKPTCKEEIVDVLKDVIWLVQNSNTPVKIPTNIPKFSYKIEKIIQFIDENLSSKELNLKWISQNIIFMNEEYLGKLFYDEVGVRFTHYLQEKRIEKAKELLISKNELSVSQIAEKIGYGENPQYFNTVFKKITSLTPNKYRKNHLSEKKPI